MGGEGGEVTSLKYDVIKLTDGHIYCWRQENLSYAASKSSKVNPVEGHLTYWTSESSRLGQLTIAYKTESISDFVSGSFFKIVKV